MIIFSLCVEKREKQEIQEIQVRRNIEVKTSRQRRHSREFTTHITGKSSRKRRETERERDRKEGRICDKRGRNQPQTLGERKRTRGITSIRLRE